MRIAGRQTAQHDRAGFCWRSTSIAVGVCLAITLTTAVLTTGQQSKRIIVGFDQSAAPYEYLDTKGKPAGFNIDLMREVGTVMGCEVDFRSGLWNDLRSQLEKGEIQVLSGMVYSEDRARLVDFTIPHTVLHHAIFIRKGDDRIHSETDLAGKELIVQKGDITNEDLLARSVPAKIITVDSPGEGLALLASGKHDCALAAQFQGLLTIRQRKLANLISAGPPLSPRDLCFAVRKGDESNLATLNEGLSIVKSTGEYERIYQTWLRNLEPRSVLLEKVHIYAAIVGIPLILGLALSLALTWMLRRKVEDRTRDITMELTERHRVEMALRESEERFRTLAEVAPVGIMIYQDESLVYANLSATRITGFGVDGLIGHHPTALAHPDFADLVKSSYQNRLEGAESTFSAYEYRIITKGGSEKWLDCAVARSTLQGQPAVIVTFSDITERRRAQEIQRALYDISEAAQTTENLDELYHAIHHIVGRLMPAENFYIALHDSQEDLLSFPYFIDEKDTKPGPIKPGRGLTSYVLRTGNPLLLTPETIGELEKRGELIALGTLAAQWLGVPLKTRDNTIGVLTVQSYRPSLRYGETEREILSYVSKQVAQAIERKRAAQEIKESQRVLQTLMSNLPGMVYRCRNDAMRTMELVSEGSTELTGYTPSQLTNIDMSYDQLINAEDLAVVRAEITNALALKHPFETSYRIHCATGQEKWVWERGRAVLSGEGEIIAIEGFVADISEKKLAEEALQLSEERYRLALQATQEIMYDWDIPGQSIYWNPNFTKVLLWAPEDVDVSVDGWTNLLHPDDKERAVRELDEAVDHGEVLSSEYRFRKRTGDYASIFDRGLIIRDASGKATRMVGAMIDLTARKDLETQLRQAQKMEAIGQLAGGVAHDFNNLLTALLASADMLQIRLNNEFGAIEELSTIKRTAMRAAELTRSLLAFSRRQVLQPIIVNINMVIRDALPILRRALPESIRIDFSPGENLGAIRVDPGQITQIIVNVCVNSRDAMADGGIITLSTTNFLADPVFAQAHSGLKPGQYVVLTASDTGKGIAEKDLPHIFEPFFTTKEIGKGTGLGLATVYGIVKQHDGFISVNSTVDKGTTFAIYLPIVPGKPDTAVSVPARATRRGSESILVVEDEAEVLHVTAQSLLRLGYRVHQAIDGIDALDVIRQTGGAIDLVIADVVMPRMGGIELHNAARNLFPDLRFLFSSGYADGIVKGDFVRQAGVFFLPKPYSIDALAEKVREVLDAPDAVR